MNNLSNLIKKYWKIILDVLSSIFTKNVGVIISKELNSYFNSLIAYVVIVVFLLVSGYFYASPIFVINRAIMRHYVTFVPLLYLFFIPAITMRLIAEEMKAGTIEILITQPIKEYEIILGKYLASVIFITLIILFTLFYPLSMLLIGNPDIGQVFTSYIGLILLGSAFAAVGIFSSSLTKNQIVAFIISFLICFAFFIMGKLTMFVPTFLAGIVDYVGMDRHFENIARGVIDTRDIIYYLSIIVFFLYMTYGLTKSRK